MPARRLARLALVAAPFVVCAAFYLPTLSGAFLSDDYAVLAALSDWSRDRHLVSGLLAKFVSGLDSPSNYYRPLTFVSFAVNLAIGGADPLVWRLTNLGLHLASGALVFVIARGLFDDGAARPRLGAPVIATTIFLLFPTSPEAVAWVSGRYDLLAVLFMLASVACFQRAHRWTDRWGITSLVGGACAFAAKESAAMLPMMIVAVAFTRRQGDAHPSTRSLRDAAPWLVLSLAYVALRTVIFGSPFRVYAGISPLDTLQSGAWLRALSTFGPWIDAALPLAAARAVFLAGLLALVALGAFECAGRREICVRWTAIAVTVIASVGLLLPHVSALAPNGEQGRLFYTTSALLAILASLSVPAPYVRSGAIRFRAIAAALLVATIAAEAILVQAVIEPWVRAGEQAKTLLAALPGIAQSLPDRGYALVLAPDHIGQALFARNAQGGLMMPPSQVLPLSSRLIVQTPEDLPAWPRSMQRGLVDALQRFPLAEAWAAIDAEKASGTVAPTHYFCWDADAGRIAPLALALDEGRRDWIEAWREALARSPCHALSGELPPQ